MELLKQGKVRPEDIDDFIDKWHDEYTGNDTIEKYLGMTIQQYDDWVNNPDSINALYNSDARYEMTIAKKIIKLAKELLQ